ncbi:hypothetical protein HZD82_23135 [Pantoea agglomerans]|nr:hypothetical protein [Pantoea agglomerans]
MITPDAIQIQVNTGNIHAESELQALFKGNKLTTLLHHGGQIIHFSSFPQVNRITLWSEARRLTGSAGRLAL